MTEQEAISKVINGDPQSFSVLYDLYLDQIYRFIYYRVNHKPTAEDLTSVVFTKAYAKFASFNPDANFAVWLYRIARNTVIDHYRTHKSTMDIENANQIASETNLSIDYEIREKLEKAQQYLASLPDEQRELVQMRLWDDLSYHEIAEITGNKPANLRVNFSRILRKMQKDLIIVIIFIALTLRI